jgi:branched-chain amino acid transport system substrate-binding protein
VWRKVLAGTAALSMAAVACSSSKSTKTSTPTTAASGAAASTAAGSASTASGTSGSINPNLPPVKIAFLSIETGTFAAPDRHNAIELAIAQLNAAGGIMGHKVEYTAYDTGILPQTTVTGVTKAISDHPTVILGLSVSSGVLAVANMLKASGIPAIQEGQDNATDLSQIGVTNMFRGQPSVHEQSQAAINFIASQHPKTVGLFDDSDLNGVLGEKTIRTALQAQGVNNFIYREIAQNATDATEAALAMKGADIATSNGFPQEEALFVKDLAINGIKVPDVMGNSGVSIADFGLAPWSAVAGDYTYTVCDPDAVHTPATDAYTAAYKAKYPSATEVATSGPYIYDAVMLVAKAIEAENGSLASADIVKGLESVTYNGVCDTYHSDAQHTTAHTEYIVQFGQTQGSSSKVAEYDNMASS